MDETAMSYSGLTQEEVQERVAAGKTNAVKQQTSRPFGQIVRGNVFTLFNAILAIAVAIVLLVGDWKDSVFGFVMVLNSLIGIASELRAKITLDRLAILNAPHATVLRDGSETKITRGQVVLDDLVLLNLGDQVPADGEVLKSTGLEIDESLLTGESLPVKKSPEDTLLAATTVISGSGLYRVTAVGPDNYAQKLTDEVRKFSLAKSELRDGINAILRIISWGIVPVAIVLFWSQLRVSGGLTLGSWETALVFAVAGVVGMIPQGLVLLTSVNFAVAAAALARRKVLVQELPAVEVLARVDILCLDKTGTLTSGKIELEKTLSVGNFPEDVAYAALKALVADSVNATGEAVRASLPQVSALVPTEIIPFNSVRKWSAITTEQGTWVLGAPEILLSENPSSEVLATVQENAARGGRVILLAHSTQPLVEEKLPTDLGPELLLVLEEQVRPDAKETLEYFEEQDVSAKVISGDNATTVAAIAQRVGLTGPDDSPPRFLDMRSLTGDEDELREAVLSHEVFGRVTPEQKRTMVRLLQEAGHTVAMTGDGVNDALALKEADLGIAMGSGSAATKAVAKIVLLDGKFSTLPGVVAEGRRIIANMERVSALFLSKTTYAVILAVVVGIFGWRYPLLPRHLTLVGTLTIGLPSLFLALAPSQRRYRPGFLRRTLWLAIPSGIVIALGLFVVYVPLMKYYPEQASTGAAPFLIICALWLLGVLARPIRLWRGILIGSMAGIASLVLIIPELRDFFKLEWPNPFTALLILGVGLVACALISFIGRKHAAVFYPRWVEVADTR